MHHIQHNDTIAALSQPEQPPVLGTMLVPLHIYTKGTLNLVDERESFDPTGDVNVQGARNAVVQLRMVEYV